VVELSGCHTQTKSINELLKRSYPFISGSSRERIQREFSGRSKTRDLNEKVAPNNCKRIN